MSHLRSFDLNQIVIFHALFESHSITDAAQRLNLTQPAVSTALRKLRDYYNDPLFIKDGKILKPTLFALGLKDTIRDIIQKTNDLAFNAYNDDLKSSKMQFHIGMPEYASFALLPNILDKFYKEAPQCTLVTSNLSRYDDIQERLKTDMGIAIGNFKKPSNDFHREIIYEEGFICLYKKNLFNEQKLTKGMFLSHKHIRVGLGGLSPSIIDDNLMEYGLSREIVTSIPHYVLGLHLVNKSDYILTCPRSVAMTFIDQFDLDYCDYPLDIQPQSIAMIWHKSTHDHKRYSSLRNIISNK